MITEEFSLSDLDTLKNQTIEELGSIKYNDLDLMVYRMELTQNQIQDIVDRKDIAAKTITYTLLPGNYEVRDLNLILDFLLPSEVNVKVTVDDSRFQSILPTKKLIKVTKNLFSSAQC